MLGVSQARMSHLMGLLLLALAIQEWILWGETPRKARNCESWREWRTGATRHTAL